MNILIHQCHDGIFILEVYKKGKKVMYYHRLFRSKRFHRSNTFAFHYCLSMVFAGLSNMTTMVMTTTLGPEFENVDRVLTKIDGINVLGKYISWYIYKINVFCCAVINHKTLIPLCEPSESQLS